MNRRQWLEALFALPLAGAALSRVRDRAAVAAPDDEAYPRKQMPATGDERRRLLWAGSSSTYYHALPVQVAAALSTSEARCFSHTVGRSGTACYKYLDEGFRYEYGVAPGQTIRDLVTTGRFDDLILQISLDHLAGEGDNDPEAFVAGIGTFQELAARAGTRLWLYEMGWANTPAYQRSRRVLRDLARRQRLPVVPCATAWWQVRRQKPELELHDLPDRTHPGIVGTYLNLSLFVAALEGKPLRDRPARTYRYWPFLFDGQERRRIRRDAHVEINDALATYLRAIANQTARAAGLFAAPFRLGVEASSSIAKEKIWRSARAQ